MSTFRPFAALLLLLAAASLAACGNKGDLVRPPAQQTVPDAPQTAPAADDVVASPAEDSR
jgi:predicted small lipoprotein YifL